MENNQNPDQSSSAATPTKDKVYITCGNVHKIYLVDHPRTALSKFVTEVFKKYVIEKGDHKSSGLGKYVIASPVGFIEQNYPDCFAEFGYKTMEDFQATHANDIVIDLMQSIMMSSLLYGNQFGGGQQQSQNPEGSGEFPESDCGDFEGENP